MNIIKWLFIIFPFYASANDVFLECEPNEEREEFTDVINYHLKTDRQIVRDGSEWIKYDEGVNGVISWAVRTDYPDGNFIEVAYYINRESLKADIFLNSPEGDFSYSFSCRKLDIKF